MTYDAEKVLRYTVQGLKQASHEDEIYTFVRYADYLAAYREGQRDMRERAVEATYRLSETRGYTTSGYYCDAIRALPLAGEDTQ